MIQKKIVYYLKETQERFELCIFLFPFQETVAVLQIGFVPIAPKDCCSFESWKPVCERKENCVRSCYYEDGVKFQTMKPVCFSQT